MDQAGDRETERQIEELRPWFHNLHLPNGQQTAPDHFLGDFPGYKWQELGVALPQDLHGWTALDIGCNAGFYTIELARRGADVTAVDMNPHYLKQARWAVNAFEVSDRVQLLQRQVYQLGELDQQFDLVLFLGVFYHLRYPLLGLDIAARKVRRLFAFQTLSMPGREVLDPGEDRDINDRAAMNEPGWPKMAFIENRLAGDPTNWWAPNHAGIEAMLRSTGMRIVSYPGTETYLCTPEANGTSPITTWDAEEFLAATGRLGTPSDP
ncbi:TIGR04290 family methyltransferase [Thiohalomonas denitrificans]|uniref:tRNA (Mo5U34)-methyltransferase n=1 Tax=Thiohalomonas denitrificans TaxID=415747 RepID=A0A1G5QF55_9GAMM|nr:TIGR04290 family methyltransferase [Thiohalomonas denitrificans]SCZ60302.1 tRNA (mo5U34)-methyltransferase [Thiohalomonas denitrificans]